MLNILRIIQLLNITTTFIAIIIGIKYILSLKENKILLTIPILTLLQVVILEILKPILKNNLNTLIDSASIIKIYIYLEYFLLAIFFWKLKHTLKEKIFLLIAFPIPLISFFISILYSTNDNINHIDIFLLIEGPIILILALNYLVNSMRSIGITNCIQEPNFYATLGIFLSFLILWPSNILFDNFLKNRNIYFNFLFISNSIAYFIFFSFLIFSFYGTRKSGIN